MMLRAPLDAFVFRVPAWSLQWVETHLEETDEVDVLMLPEEVSSLVVDGYVAHPLFALVVLIEYTIR